MKSQYEKSAEAGWSAETMREHSKLTPEYLEHEALLKDRRSPLSVSLADLQAAFGSAEGAAYWSQFVIRRPLSTIFTYPTEWNPASEHPLIEFKEGEAVLTVGNMLYEGVLARLSKLLSDDKQLRARYLTRRDVALEQRVSKLVQRLFPEGEHYSECYEQPDSQFEHDHVVIWNRKLLVFESKASPPPEPFRDPDKAYERLRRSFRSDSGIQAAFGQSNRLRRAYIHGQPIRLYDVRGKLLREVGAEELDAAYCVCVTANNHGPLAVDLSMLLVKEDADHYPWAVSANDLDSTIGAFERKGWGASKFCEFLDQRQLLQGKALTDDELEIVGAFVLYGTLDFWLSRPADKIYFQNGFARVFDAIYEEKRGGPVPELEATGPPFFHDPRSLMSDLMNLAGTEILTTPMSLADLFHTDAPSMHIGRNHPCPCGSGKKFKRCCSSSRR